MMRPQTTSTSPLAGDAFPWLVGLFAAVVAVAWAGAALASVAHGTPRVPDAADVGAAVVPRAGHRGDPRAAWPAEFASKLPAATAYWCCQLVAVAAAGGLAVMALRLA